MKIRIAIVAATVLAMLASTLVLAGCNTWKGVGKDVERTGEAMQGD